MVEGGAESVHSDKVELNASGRNIQQQVELEMQSRVSRMLDKGYKYSRDEALAGATNQLGLLNPMLAQPLDKVTNLSFEVAFVQPKLDGHRCLITNHNGHIIAYSRKGKIIDTVPHIASDFRWLSPGRTVDGELYIHGESLQSLSSLIKRQQPGSSRLRYHWYDYVAPEGFEVRHRRMWEAANKISMSYVDLVETHQVEDMHKVYSLFRSYRSSGYEGAMLRLPYDGYEDNKRARQLIKVKERKDCEVTVLGAVPSKDGWAVLRVRTDWEAEFDLTAPGSVPEKLYVMENISKYIGERLTIEYAHLTSDGIPFHAVAIRWREDI
jgi:DNA ligase-1